MKDDTTSGATYERVVVLTREQIVDGLSSSDPLQVEMALFSATSHDEDSLWVESQCIERLQSADFGIRKAAATCLGDLAFLRRRIDKQSAVAALERAMKEPELSDVISFSLSLIEQFA
jgi:hypothetical protein